MLPSRRREREQLVEALAASQREHGDALARLNAARELLRQIARRATADLHHDGDALAEEIENFLVRGTGWHPDPLAKRR